MWQECPFTLYQLVSPHIFMMIEQCWVACSKVLRGQLWYLCSCVMSYTLTDYTKCG